MNSPEISRVSISDLTADRFRAEFLAKNVPVIVTGALSSWNLQKNWTPAALRRDFGSKTVQVYNNYFDLKGLMPLSKYFDQHFDQPEDASRTSFPYVRWYTQLRDAKFVWADDAFAEMTDRWGLPPFLPSSEYVLPLVPRGENANPAFISYPAKGLFISRRGGRTGLHVDPWGSCAALCQLHGTKHWYLYSPDQEQFLRNGEELVDIKQPNKEKFPDFDKATLTAQCIIHPGEVMYVPHGWFHHVDTLTDSVSMTWNFVHSTTATALEAWLEHQPLSAMDQSVLRFFYKIEKDENVLDRSLQIVREQKISASRH